jgi:hypothetical protein
VGTDARLESLGVGYEPAHSAIAVGEGVNELEAVVRDRDGRYARGCAQRLQAKFLLEMVHERGHHGARRRHVTSHNVVVSGFMSKYSGLHPVRAAGSLDGKELDGGIVVESLVQRADEACLCRFAQLTREVALVDGLLHADVRAGFELQVASLRLRFELIGQRALDIARARVVALDQVAVVAVHHADQVREARGGQWMKARS